MIKSLIALISLFGCLVLCGATKEEYRYFKAMGTVIELTLVGEAEQLDLAFKLAKDEIDLVLQMANLYDKNSELSRLNNTASQSPFQCSNELYSLLKTAYIAYEQSEYTFDITAKPLMDLWGFYRQQKNALPTQTEIDNTLTKVGFNKVEFCDINQTIYFTIEGMALDLGGVAKGYALDRIYQRIETLVEGGIINIGGNIRLIPQADRVYKIGIKSPFEPIKLAQTLPLESGAISTSGDYEKFVEYNGKKYAHIINPLTGYPAESLNSVTVTTELGVNSDWMSTAVFIGGERVAKQIMADYPNTQALIFQPNDEIKGNSRIYSK